MWDVCVIGKTINWGERQLKNIICYSGNVGSEIRRNPSFATFLHLWILSYIPCGWYIWKLYVPVPNTCYIYDTKNAFPCYCIIVSVSSSNIWFIPAVYCVQCKVQNLVNWTVCTHSSVRFFAFAAVHVITVLQQTKSGNLRVHRVKSRSHPHPMARQPLWASASSLSSFRDHTQTHHIW
jgi:hypothetical protein